MDLWKRLYIWWKHVFIVRYLYHMIYQSYQYQIFYIILSSQPLYHNVYFYCTISLKIVWLRINDNNNRGVIKVNNIVTIAK